VPGNPELAADLVNRKAVVDQQDDPASQRHSLRSDPSSHPPFERSTIVIGEMQPLEMRASTSQVNWLKAHVSELHLQWQHSPETLAPGDKNNPQPRLVPFPARTSRSGAYCHQALKCPDRCVG
jgi:hypothetical protein